MQGKDLKLTDNNMIFEMRYNRRDFMKITLATGAATCLPNILFPKRAEANPAFILIGFGCIALVQGLAALADDGTESMADSDMEKWEKNRAENTKPFIVMDTDGDRRGLGALPAAQDEVDEYTAKFGNRTIASGTASALYLARSDDEIWSTPHTSGLLASSLWYDEKEWNRSRGVPRGAPVTRDYTGKVNHAGYSKIIHQTQRMERGWNRGVIALNSEDGILHGWTVSERQ